MSSTTASKPTGGLLGGLVRRATGTPQDRARKAKVEKKVPTIAEVLAGPGGAPAAVELPAGKVVATGADAAAAEKGRKPASRWMPVRIVVGCWTAPKALRAYAVVTELDADAAAAREAKDATKIAWFVAKQQEIAAARQAKIAKLVREVIPVWVPSLLGGWPVATAAFVALTALWFWLKKAGGSAHGVVVERLAEAAVVSLAWTILTCWWAGGVSAGYGWRNGIVTALAMLAVLGPLVGWAVWATKDDGTIEDNLRAGEGGVVIDATPEPGSDGAVVKAITSSSAALAKDAVVRVVAPGVVRLAEGKVWQVTVDTGGPTSQPIIDAIDDIASRMNLDAASCFPERVPGLGRQVRITAVVKDPLAEQIPSPLVGMDQVNIFDGVPWGTTIVGDRITLLMVFHNYLIGGLPDMGKSTSGAPILDAYVLSPRSKLWIIDGGRVDTAPINRLGLAHRWVANDPAAAAEVLKELDAYADERQEQLDEFGAIRPGFGKKITPEFCEYYGVAPDVLWWDEFASHMNCSDKDIKREIRSTANSVLQRIRKLGITAVLSTQSPSSIAIDTDGRDVISDRFALPCSTPQMSDKILGPGEAKAGHNAQRLPRRPGRGYLSTSRGGVVIAQSDWISDEQHEEIYRRGVELRRGTKVLTAADDDRLLLAKVVGLIKAQGATVRGQRVMRLRDVAAALDGMDQMELRKLLSDQGVGTQIVRRTDDPTADNRAHYVLADFPPNLAALL